MGLQSLAFLAGILILLQFSGLPALAVLWSLCALLLLTIPRRTRPLGFLVAGFLWAALQSHLILADRLAPALEGADLRIEGVVTDLPTVGERGWRFEFAIERAWQDGEQVVLPARVRLSTYGMPFRPEAGHRYALTARLKRPHAAQNPGAFDYEAYLFQMRLGATGYVREQPPPESRGPAPGWQPALSRLRARISARIDTALPDAAMAPILRALANGDDSGIGDAQWESLRRSGTLHLVAISGMHITLIAGLVFWLTRRFWSAVPGLPLRWPAQKAAALAGLIAAIGYTALAGFGIPVMRALIMLAVALGARLLGRQVAVMHLLAAALLAVLVFDPLAVLSAGFWLSFAAVAVILLVANERPQSPQRFALLRNWGRVQWAITLGLAPLLLVLFQQVSLVSPIANAVAIPVIEFMVVPLTLMGVLGGMFDIDASRLYQAAAAILDTLWPFLDWCASLGHAVWTRGAPPFWLWLMAFIGVALLIAPRGFPGRWLGLFWLLPALTWLPPRPGFGDVWLTQIDVGQGLSVIVRTRSHVLVFDAGPRHSARFDAGRAYVTPVLRHHGVERIDRLVVSHDHNDHAGGTESLIAEWPVGEVVSAQPLAARPVRACRAGEHWEWDGVRFQWLHPDEGVWRGNDDACVLMIAGAHGRALLPGDISRRAERSLVTRHGPQLRADVIVVPHHGSRSSSSAVFLDQVTPRLALLPVGYRNRYRHPHPDVMARYRERAIPVVDSATQGAIEVRLTAAGPAWEGWRDRAGRFWHAH